MCSYIAVYMYKSFLESILILSQNLSACNKQKCCLFYHSSLQELYVQFTSALLSSVTNPDHQKKLLSALQSLTPPSLQLDNSQNSKRQFKKNMQEFLPDIRGCVCLK